jgi:hypothetical protein
MSQDTKTANKEINERLMQAFKAVIDQQIAENDPPETVETHERLIEEGFTVDESYSLIAQVIGMEVAEEIAGESGINMDRFKVALSTLPEPFAKPRHTEEED